MAACPRHSSAGSRGNRLVSVIHLHRTASPRGWGHAMSQSPTCPSVPAPSPAHSVCSGRIWPLLMASILVQPGHLPPGPERVPRPWPPSPSSPRQPPEGTCEHLSQVMSSSAHTLQGSHLPLGRSRSPPKAHKALHDLLPPSLPSPRPTSPPRSLCSSHRGLLAIPLMNQALSCPRAFARAVLKCLPLRPVHGSLSRLSDIGSNVTFLVTSSLISLVQITALDYPPC